jgi:hypothetical protein
MIEHAFVLSLAGVVTWVPSPRALGPAVLRAAVNEPEAGTRQRAAEAFAAGERAYEAERWEAAAEHFEQAQRLAPHPFTAFNLGLAQVRAGRTLEAWHTFERLANEADDPKDRAEARAQQVELREQVAMLRVDAREGALVCVDEAPVPRSETVVVLPGAHRVEVDGAEHRVELEGGETRHVDVRGEPGRARAVRPLLGVAIGAGVLALGTGLGTLGTQERGAEIGLAVTAGTAAALAVGTTIAALVVHSRPRARRRAAGACGTSTRDVVRSDR